MNSGENDLNCFFVCFLSKKTNGICIFLNIKSKLSERPYVQILGWSAGAMVLGKLPVPGRPTDLDLSRARTFCACRRCGWGCLDIFSLVYQCSFLSPSLWETARYRLK